MSNTDNWALGWAFYRAGGVTGGQFLPLMCDDLVEWIKGFAAAQADYDLEPQEFCSIEEALLAYGVAGELLNACLDAADNVASINEWNRWPCVPVRGIAPPKTAANDEKYASPSDNGLFLV